MASLGKLHGAQAGAIEPEMVRVLEGWFGMGCESGRVYYRAADQIPDRAGAPTKSGQAGGTGRTAWLGEGGGGRWGRACVGRFCIWNGNRCGRSTGATC